MATTQTSKIKVRQGDFSALPLLDSGEFGYALDEHRLFIGNLTVNIGTGDAATASFIVPHGLSTPTTLSAVFVDGIEINPSYYTIAGTTLTFSSPPANNAVITATFNSEVEIKRHATLPNYVQLAASGTNAETGFSVDTTSYNVVIMDYTLHTSNGVRVGQLRFATDTTASTTSIDDNYTETAPVDIVFSVDIGTTNTLKLMYTDNDNAIAKFKYTYQLWNSN